MILIADSGSTKTDWVLIKEGKVKLEFRTEGLHPNLIDKLHGKIVFQGFDVNLVKQIKFYGSGCMSKSNACKVQEFLTDYFINAQISVQSDLVGAGKALFGEGMGLVGILGTGSAVCFYHNEEIDYKIPSLGLILGDEGSGADLGKKLINAVYTKSLSDHLIRKFEEEFSKSYSEIIKELNQSSQKGKYLSGFVSFLHKYKDDNEIKALLLNSFEDFFRKYILKYSTHERRELGLIGSVSYFFEKEISELAKKYNIQLVKVIRYPLNNIVSELIKLTD